MTAKEHYSKPWLSIDDQIQLVESRGMTDAHEYELEFRRIGYYRLSGYWYSFRKINPDTGERSDDFIDGIRFADVMKLYNYDDRLRSVLFSALSKIEVAFRVKICYVLGKRDPLAYLKPTMLKEDLDIGKYASFVHEFLDGQWRSEEPFAEHFKNDYDGEMPIWAATEMMTLSMLAKLFICMKAEDREAIAAEFGVTRGALQSWLPTLKELRNRCAHQARMFDYKTSNVIPNWNQRPELMHVKEFIEKSYGRKMRQAREQKDWATYRELDAMPYTTKIYGLISVLAYMLRVIGDYDEVKFIRECLKDFPLDIKTLSPLKTMGIPDHWQEQALWQISAD